MFTSMLSYIINFQAAGEIMSVAKKMKHITLLPALCVVVALCTAAAEPKHKDEIALHQAEKKMRSTNLIPQARELCEGMSSRSYKVDFHVGMGWSESKNRTYFYQSKCYQSLAERSADASLCDKVKQRRSLLHDSDMVSSQLCKAKVAAKVVANKNSAQRSADANAYKASLMKITTLEITKTSKDKWQVSLMLEGKLVGDYQLAIRVFGGNKSFRAPDDITMPLTVTSQQQPLVFMVDKNQFNLSVDAARGELFSSSFTLYKLKHASDGNTAKILSNIKNTYFSTK
jgi:hypothetical protein